ncbi:hypothetical protein ABCR94_04725 [Streptomyces sp. 21So2-11]|uniref:hypothetical protein n=1 Tax=Streptomyces sp. 21So2-11 TaxID=3144408 RepID=UPI003218F0E5
MIAATSGQADSADTLSRLHRGPAGEAARMVQTKKIALYVIVVFVLYTIITSPGRAADLVQVGFEGIASAAQGVGEFMSELVQ